MTQQSTTKSPDYLKRLPKEKQQRLIALLQERRYRWGLTGRPSQQLPEGDWNNWLIKTGRGWGKTRTGAENVRIWKDNYPIIHLIGRTAADVRDAMIEGESGILAISPEYDYPKYETSKRKLTWPNGAKALMFSAEDPDVLRGPQCYKAWCDELAAWKYAQETWDNLQFGLRLGDSPQSIITTTPRPIGIIKDLIADPTSIVTTGSTYENEANLAERFIKTIEAKYKGTRLGRQEIEAEILEDVEGALWTMAMIEEARVGVRPDMERVVVAIDPAVTNKEGSDETGIIIGGLYDDKGYVLEDVSGKYTPNEWAQIAVNKYHQYKADRIIGEVNNGGDLIESVLRNIDSAVSYKSVHATRGKVLRAEPVVSLYEQHRIKHIGSFPDLETQMTTWVQGERSPDRVDALVWLFTELIIDGQGEWFVI